MGRQREVYCNICIKAMRSDTLKRHIKKHQMKYIKEEYPKDKTFEINMTSETEIERNTTEEKIPNTEMENENLRKILRKYNSEYNDKINLGERIYNIVGQEGIKEESIPSVYKEALDLFVKQKQAIDQTNVILRPWQEELLTKIENPTDREVIWVRGAKGCEGKTWFQEYVESKYGWNRVVNEMDIKAKNTSICHALGKRLLTTTDIFLFNVGKANTMDEVNYEVLEKIKDGKLLASKYDSKELRIRTPNVVMVFSNDSPKLKQLATDRWCIYSISDNEFKDITTGTYLYQG